MTEYYTFLVAISIALYFIVTDENLSKVVWLKILIASVNIKKYWLMARLYPKLKYDRWMLDRALKKAMKTLEEQSD